MAKHELFITKGNCGLFFEPENEADLIEKILQITTHKNLALQYGKNGRLFVNEFFNRENIANNFYNELLKIK